MYSSATLTARLHALVASAPTAQLAEAFAAAGHELALVGGPVRDAFLDRPVTDLDFASSATPDEILALVAPLADATWDVGREFGSPVSPDYGPKDNAFGGEVAWVQIDLEGDDHDHLIAPEERFHVAMAKQ